VEKRQSQTLRHLQIQVTISVAGRRMADDLPWSTRVARRRASQSWDKDHADGTQHDQAKAAGCMCVIDTPARARYDMKLAISSRHRVSKTCQGVLLRAQLGHNAHFGSKSRKPAQWEDQKTSVTAAEVGDARCKR